MQIAKTIFSFIFLSVLLFSTAYSDDTPNVGFDNAGNGAAVWVHPVTGGNSLIKASVFSFLGNSWTTPVTISSTGIASSAPFIAVATTGFFIGHAVAIWSGENTSAGVTSLYAAIHSNGGSWTSPVQVSTNSENVSGNYEARINSAGNVVAIWESADSSGNELIRSSNAQSPTNTWKTPITVGGP